VGREGAGVLIASRTALALGAADPGELRLYRHGKMAGRATTRGQPPKQQQ